MHFWIMLPVSVTAWALYWLRRSSFPIGMCICYPRFVTSLFVACCRFSFLLGCSRTAAATVIVVLRWHDTYVVSGDSLELLQPSNYFKAPTRNEESCKIREGKNGIFTLVGTSSVTRRNGDVDDFMSPTLLEPVLNGSVTTNDAPSKIAVWKDYVVSVMTDLVQRSPAIFRSRKREDRGVTGFFFLRDPVKGVLCKTVGVFVEDDLEVHSEIQDCPKVKNAPVTVFAAGEAGGTMVAELESGASDRAKREKLLLTRAATQNSLRSMIANAEALVKLADSWSPSLAGGETDTAVVSRNGSRWVHVKPVCR